MEVQSDQGSVDMSEEPVTAQTSPEVDAQGFESAADVCEQSSHHPSFVIHPEQDCSFIIPAEILSTVEIGTMLELDLQFLITINQMYSVHTVLTVKRKQIHAVTTLTAVIVMCVKMSWLRMLIITWPAMISHVAVGGRGHVQNSGSGT